MDLRKLVTLGGALFLAACGGGTMKGKVTVEGGSAAGIAVVILGPQSAAAVTADDGTFSAGGLSDGNYVVRATVRGADVEEVSVATRMSGGKADPEPTLAFKFATSKVTGKVVFADGSDSAGLAVTLSGTASRGVKTGAGGAFSFEGVPAGAYIVAAEAPDTREGRVGVSVATSGATTDVGELRLTPTGHVAGIVTYNAGPVANCDVSVAGTSVRSTTDAVGHFELVGIPAGDVTVVARASLSRSVTETLRINRGANVDLALALADDPPAGTLKGVVTFIGQQSPRVISVTIPGANPATANGELVLMPAVNGAFSSPVPAGEWDVYASAAFHPRQHIGHVRVAAGQTTVMPAAVLSWYEPLWESDATINSVSTLGTSATAPWVVVRVTDTQKVRSVLINTRTRDLRVLALGSVSLVRFSANARYVGFTLGSSQLFTYELATGDLKQWGTSVSSYDFSTDESVLFMVRNNVLERVVIASGARTLFPASGTATQILEHTPDRWLVRDPSNDVRLVTPASETAQLFSAVSVVSVTPTPWALTNCTVNCTLRVVTPNGTTNSMVSGTVAVSTSSLGTSGDYPGFYNPAASQYLIVKAADGTATILPAGTSSVVFNDIGTRYAFITSSGGTATLREEALPPGSPMPLFQTTAAYGYAYVSSTRLVMFEASGARRFVDVKSGVATIEPDVATASSLLAPPLFVYPQQSTSKWRAFIGDKGTLTIDEAAATPVQNFAVRSFGGTAEPVTDYACVSYEATTSWIIDEKTGMVRRFLNGQCYSAMRSGTTEFYLAQRQGYPTFAVFGSGEPLLEYSEPRMVLTTLVGTSFERAVLALDEGRHTLWIGGFR